MPEEFNNTTLNVESGLKEKALFLSRYSSLLYGSGVHTSRVIRNTKRVASALDLDLRIDGFHKSLMLTAVSRETGDHFNILTEIPEYPNSFELNKDLSQLSWEAIDEHLSFDEISRRYEALTNKPEMNPYVVLALVSFANASFCALFGGDWISIGIVFIATLTGMFIKQKLTARKVNQFLTFTFCSFIASMVASSSVFFNTTSEIALATSVLYLIPGVPLINGFIDIMEGHVLSGSARLINAFLLILCIAIGTSVAIVLFRDSLL
jgi:uncharacterized membrane protein YjjP (DUF1212 family)